jgi:hypothetical protein
MIEEPIYKRKDYIHPRSIKRRDINFRLFEGTSTVQSHYARGR